MLDGTLLLRDHNNPKVRRAVDSGYTFHYVHDPHDIMTPLMVQARKHGDSAGSATFNLGNTAKLGGLVRDHAIVQNVKVHAGHERKGVATTMYVLAEIVLGVPMVNDWGRPESPQSDEAKALWAQANRPFGRDQRRG